MHIEFKNNASTDDSHPIPAIHMLLASNELKRHVAKEYLILIQKQTKGLRSVDNLYHSTNSTDKD
jgi:hypothetical protein